MLNPLQQSYIIQYSTPFAFSQSVLETVISSPERSAALEAEVLELSVKGAIIVVPLGLKQDWFWSHRRWEMSN